jgi:hypothetical protein
MGDEFAPIIEEVDFALAEMAALKASGPHLRILHKLHQSGTNCCPGEQIALVSFVYRTRAVIIPLSPTQNLLVDYLARCRLPGTASQIEAGVRSDPFCVHHGANARTRGKQTRTIGRMSVKVHIERIRRALQIAFREAGVEQLDPYRVLVSEPTTGNQVLYALKGHVDWTHTR